MNQEIKTKWLTALRSGKYEQGKGFLKNLDNNFCCLGVLCDIAIKENPELGKWVENDNDNYDEGDSITNHYVIETKDGDESGVLPDAIRSWANMESPNPYITTKGMTLAQLNDQGNSFNQIADIIANTIL